MPKIWRNHDRSIYRTRCKSCDLLTGFGVSHRIGCPVGPPPHLSGTYYSPAEVARFCGVTRPVMSPYLRRVKEGCPKESDAPFVFVNDRPGIEREKMVEWLAHYKPHWLAKMRDVEERGRACENCLGLEGDHVPGCYMLIPRLERRKMVGFCKECGKRMKELKDFGFQKCRRCRTLAAIRMKFRRMSPWFKKQHAKRREEDERKQAAAIAAFRSGRETETPGAGGHS